MATVSASISSMLKIPQRYSASGFPSELAPGRGRASLLMRWRRSTIRGRPATLRAQRGTR